MVLKMTMRIALVGTGRMGSMIRECAADRGIEVAAEFDVANIGELAEAPKLDAVIDFSAPASLSAVAAYVERTGTPLVSGTTGYTAEEQAQLAGLGRFAPVVASANYSIGVAVMKHLAAETAKLLLSAIDPEGKRRAVFGREGLAPRMEGEIGVHAVRGGTVAGVHEVKQ